MVCAAFVASLLDFRSLPQAVMTNPVAAMTEITAMILNNLFMIKNSFDSLFDYSIIMGDLKANTYITVLINLSRCDKIKMDIYKAIPHNLGVRIAM